MSNDPDYDKLMNLLDSRQQDIVERRYKRRRSEFPGAEMTQPSDSGPVAPGSSGGRDITRKRMRAEGMPVVRPALVPPILPNIRYFMTPPNKPRPSYSPVTTVSSNLSPTSPDTLEEDTQSADPEDLSWHKVRGDSPARLPQPGVPGKRFAD